MKKFFNNFYVKTIIGVFLTLFVGRLYVVTEASLTKSKNEKEARLVDSTNSKNVRDQFWDLFSDQYNKTNRLEKQLDSLIKQHNKNEKFN